MSTADGTWNCTMDTPMGGGAVTLILETNGNVLSGTLKSDQGEMAFTDGTVDGDNLSWVVKVDQPMPMEIATKATIDGDTLTGEATLGSFGSAKLTGTRA